MDAREALENDRSAKRHRRHQTPRADARALRFHRCRRAHRVAPRLRRYRRARLRTNRSRQFPSRSTGRSRDEPYLLRDESARRLCGRRCAPKLGQTRCLECRRGRDRDHDGSSDLAELPARRSATPSYAGLSFQPITAHADPAKDEVQANDKTDEPDCRVPATASTAICRG